MKLECALYEPEIIIPSSRFAARQRAGQVWATIPALPDHRAAGLRT
jgi:hypothetical protein